MEKATGVVVVRLNGSSIRSKAGAELEMGGYERKEQIADGQVQAYTETPVPAKVSATLLHLASSDLTAIRDTVDATLLFESDAGPRFTIRGAFCSKPPVLTGGDGDCKVEFMGKASTESA